MPEVTPTPPWVSYHATGAPGCAQLGHPPRGRDTHAREAASLPLSRLPVTLNQFPRIPSVFPVGSSHPSCPYRSVEFGFKTPEVAEDLQEEWAMPYMASAE